ncbi:hypothetical protein BCR33DRAFT_788341 [Rhizoclosmatium globosum]|uniref:Uncharacterized protein n=1 Tax=Rhizoclosmatium globosum TaxID=329046 RepID=A0A1Y2BX49_9FUNG|nr:hypothetical protein BCR33DRAFT_788341 [Rhizoclosmatium globosum]|eukprot:ORY39326.1 hypothetical protein BCR33DRAFT_788341 [Rhizoclosmatium globosum]
MPPTRIQSTDSSTSSPYPQYSYPYLFPKSAHNSALTATPTFLKSGPVSAYHTPATPSVFTAPPYASLNLKKRTQIHRRLGISVAKEDAKYDTTDMSRQSSLSSAKTLHERISVLSFDEESKSVKGVVKGSETGGVFEVVGSKTAISITPQDIVLFLDAIKELVVIPDGGVLSIPDDQMGTIRSSVFSFYDLVFDSTDSNSTNASEYCLTQTPHLLLTLKYITNPPLPHLSPLLSYLSHQPTSSKKHFSVQQPSSTSLHQPLKKPTKSSNTPTTT